MATIKSKLKQTKTAANQKAEYHTYLLDFDHAVIAFLAQDVTQEEAKRVAAETDCGHNQMVVVSHYDWDWTGGELDAFTPITIRKIGAA